MIDKELNNKLHVKLKDIADVLCDSTDKFDNPGVLAGNSGLALFMFYYSRFTGDTKYVEFGENSLEKAVKMINSGYNFHTFCSGISGLAWTCEHLAQHGFVDHENISFLKELEPYLLSCMEKDFRDGNYDFLHGGLGVGYYFLKKRTPDSMSNKLLYHLIKDTSITCTDGCLKWESTLSDSGKRGFNISLSHGMSSIVVCLENLMKRNPHVLEIKETLLKTIEYILQQQFTKPGISYFPSYSIESENNSQPSRLGWCYGDLGIAQAILQSSRSLGNMDYENIAAKILLHGCDRKNLRENFIVDAGICHGTSGLSHIFNRLNKCLKNKLFKNMSHYWMEKTIEMNMFSDGLAGFKSWRGDKGWVNTPDLLNGLTGIGLSIMSYLNPDCMDWDECLLLS